MKKKIILKRIFHHGVWRYAIFFQYDQELTEIVRKIDGATFSGSLKCWHVKGEEESLRQIFLSFRDKADIDISSIALPSQRENDFNHLSDDYEKHSEPDKKNHESDSLPPLAEFNGKSTYHGDSSGLGAVRFSIDTTNSKLVIKFLGKFDKEWIKEIKSYGKFLYDTSRKEWLLPWSQLVVDSLSDYFNSRGVEIFVQKITIPENIKKSRDDHAMQIRDHVLGEEAKKGIEMVRQYLEERRYSIHTIEAYASLLEVFFKYYSSKEPDDITEKDISDFFQNHVATHNYSTSYQNQLVSSIKMFYHLYGRGRIDISLLGRPRRSRTLPKVFSKEEIKKILNSSINLKHKLILWMIYSCGLRRSEVINISLKDLDRDRGILNIREAKGKVDRIVPVSPKVWGKIDEYLDAYKPVTWLFEGQGGGKYSVESVYNIFKKAVRKSGIKKEVGVHSLRHSYATHLHENGLDIRYIQELLGHKSTRTTEIYTHVSRRNLIAIHSPIEDIDL